MLLHRRRSGSQEAGARTAVASRVQSCCGSAIAPKTNDKHMAQQHVPLMQTRQHLDVSFV